MIDPNRKMTVFYYYGMYVVEWEEHDGREWSERTDPSSSRWMRTARLIPEASVEGTLNEMKAMAGFMLNPTEGGVARFKRCAVSFEQDGTFRLWSPNNWNKEPDYPHSVEAIQDLAHKILALEDILHERELSA